MASPGSARNVQEWIPATAGLAADHLLALLRDAAVRRCASCSTKPALHKPWQDAIADVHAEYFEEYRLWHRQLELDVSVTWHVYVSS
jgi:hypothetical protein